MIHIKGEKLIRNQYKIATILVYSINVSGNISLPLATIITIGTLKTRLLAAFVAQMPFQSALPHKNTGTIRTLMLCMTISDVILPPSPEETCITYIPDTCEHKDNSTWLLMFRSDCKYTLALTLVQVSEFIGR